MYSLKKFNVIAACDAQFGIGRNNAIPWKCKEDLALFKEKTKNCVVIVGRVTFEKLPPLPDRDIIVVGVRYLSLVEAFKKANRDYDKPIWVIGGQQLYTAALREFGYLCDKIYISYINKVYDCDRFFPLDDNIKLDSVKDYHDFQLLTCSYRRSHDEYKYLETLQHILDNGEICNADDERTGTGTIKTHGVMMKFNVKDCIPVITTKKIFLKGIFRELEWFLKGQTSAIALSEQGVKFWDANTSRETLDKLGLELKEGDAGPIYGFQWRHFGAEYKSCDDDYKDEGIDQVKELIENIKKNPLSRRHIISAWNPVALKEMALPPCHILSQWHVSADKKYLDCTLYQRSGDMFLGVPFNITSYSLMMYYIAGQTGLIPRTFTHMIGDAHIYLNHIEQVKRQIARTPLPFPKLEVSSDNVPSIDDLDKLPFNILGYFSWPGIKAPMAF